MIKCKNINLSFGTNTIFHDWSIEIKRGENVALKGISGKGKSTFFKLLQGYILPQSGEIMINNLPLKTDTIKKIRDNIIWVPQNINLPVKTGFDLIQLMNLSDNKANIIYFLEKLDLSEYFLQKKFSEISGGQKQRILLSVCLSIKRNILLLDEPTSALDAGSIEHLVKIVKSLSDKTIISASHNKYWLQTVDRIINI